jgi:hypothetical protein
MASESQVITPTLPSPLKGEGRVGVKKGKSYTVELDGERIGTIGAGLETSAGLALTSRETSK